MFGKLFALFAVLAVAFAAPKPEPAPQVITYNAAGYDYLYPGSAYPSVVSSYSAPFSAYPYATYTYPANTVFVK